MKSIHNNSKLSLKAKGLYYELDNGDLNTVPQKDFPKVTKDGMTSVESAFRELYHNGLLKMHRGKTGIVKYTLIKPDISKDKDITKLIIRFLRDNYILISKRKKYRDEILKMVQNGCTFDDFFNAVSLMYDVKNLVLSRRYLQAYKHGEEGMIPGVEYPWSYVISTVKNGQILAHISDMRTLMNIYIKPKTYKDIKKYKTESPNATIPDNWVEKDKLEYVNIDVFDTSLYRKYFVPKAKN